MLFFNRKAYTLSQFILLWVLGILFVILVSLNVLRYRATAHAREAEAFMQEVRAEQEDRCALGRKYAVYNNHLKTFYKRNQGTKHIRYDLSSGHGITARHKLLDFQLQMPSYADGRICCDNCGKLNHYYAKCDVLQKRKDFIASDPECTVYSTTKKEKALSADKAPVAQPDAQPEQADVLQPTEKSMADLVTAETISQDPKKPVETSVSADTSVEAGAQPISAEETVSVTASSLQTTQGTVTAESASQAQTQPMQTPDSISTEQKPAVATKRVCKIPAQGDFFIDECEVYQEGARGSVVHTWNFERCAYEVTQTCMIPARWKRNNETKEEKGLYPSDLDDYCTQLLKQSACPAGAAAGRECGTVDETCYKSCQITEQTEVKESALIILYDVQVKIEQLRCMPAKEVTVTIP